MAKDINKPKNERPQYYWKTYICLASLVSTLAIGWSSATDAWADEQSGPVAHGLEHIDLRLKAVEQAVEKRLLLESLGLYVYGYLDGSYTQNFNDPSNGINELRSFDVDSNEFRPNLAQFVLRRDAKSDGNWTDRLGLELKFNTGKDSAFIGGVNLNPYADFQEFYVQYIAPVGRGLNLQFGQMNSLVG